MADFEVFESIDGAGDFTVNQSAALPESNVIDVGVIPVDSLTSTNSFVLLLLLQTFGEY